MRLKYSIYLLEGSRNPPVPQEETGAPESAAPTGSPSSAAWVYGVLPCLPADPGHLLEQAGCCLGGSGCPPPC